jgi:hypothetical protein
MYSTLPTLNGSAGSLSAAGASGDSMTAIIFLETISCSINVALHPDYYRAVYLIKNFPPASFSVQWGVNCKWCTNVQLYDRDQSLDPRLSWQLQLELFANGSFGIVVRRIVALLFYRRG